MREAVPSRRRPARLRPQILTVETASRSNPFSDHPPSEDPMMPAPLPPPPPPATVAHPPLPQDYPYPFDVWLADEHPDRATQEWCAEHGIRISCRFGVPQYHRPAWPRRTRCKEGNLSFFYDNWGYEMYEIVAQFDADHVPDPNYLSSCLPAFLDPQVRA